MLASYCVNSKPYLLGKHFKIYQELRMPGTFVHCTQATLTSCRMGAVVLVLVAMTAVGPTAGVTRTAPWFAGRDLQQQQYMTRIQITNKGPPITAAFVASDKSYHHLNIPTTKNTDTALLEDMFINKLSPPSNDIYDRSVSPSISTLIQGQDTGNVRNDAPLLRQ